MDRLALPAPATPARRDGLWRHSCFELFARAADGRYAEFNLAPSGEWAAYRFDSYRSGMRPLDPVAPPNIGITHENGGLTLAARIDPGALGLKPVRMALSAVIETVDGGKSYFALAHPPGAPDFHHEDCFQLELPAAKSP